jgi:hypothetical protein
MLTARQKYYALREVFYEIAIRNLDPRIYNITINDRHLYLSISCSDFEHSIYLRFVTVGLTGKGGLQLGIEINFSFGAWNMPRKDTWEIQIYNNFDTAQKVFINILRQYKTLKAKQLQNMTS